MNDEELLKSQWRELYADKLVEHALTHGWPVFRDHCIARIIYDHVAGAKWDEVWEKPAMHKMGTENLKRCIAVAQDLQHKKLDAETLNIQSLKFRGKI